MSTPANSRDGSPDQQHEPDRDVDAADPLEHADRAEVEVDARQARVDVRPSEVRRREPGSAVGPDGEERDVTEVEQPCVADHHVQAERHHHVDGHDHHRVHARRIRDDGHAPGPEPVLGDEDRVQDGEREHRHRDHVLPDVGRHDVEREDDPDEDHEREARLRAASPDDEQREHDRGQEGQHLDPARLPCPAPLRVVDAKTLEAPPEELVERLPEQEQRDQQHEHIELDARLECPPCPGGNEQHENEDEEQRRVARPAGHGPPRAAQRLCHEASRPPASARRAAPAGGTRG